MATLGTKYLTLLDVAKMKDPDGSVPELVDLISQECPLLGDGYARFTNAPLSHRSIVVTEEPTTYPREINAGVLPSKGRTAPITEGLCMLEGLAQTDVKIKELEDDWEGVLLSAALMRMSSIVKAGEEIALYGNTATNPAHVNGFMTRKNTLGDFVLSAGGTSGNQTSVLIIGWGRDKTQILTPKNGTAGVRQKYLGEILVDDPQGVAGAKMLAHVDQISLDFGTSMPDHRYQVRIGNIDVAALKAMSGTQLATASTFLYDLVVDAIERIPNLSACNPIVYCNRWVKSRLRVQERIRAAGNLGLKDAAGRPVMDIIGVPVHVADRISLAESVLS